jgi:hypothetical protein
VSVTYPAARGPAPARHNAGMTLRLVLRLALLVAAFAGLPAAHADTDAAPPTTLNFMGVPYLHRWSQAGQNEFTPLSQSDLAKWHDMVTLQVYDKVSTSEQLATIANTVLVSYQKAGLIIRTHSIAAKPDRPAQHMIVAVLSDVGVRELVFARFRMTPEVGEAIVYSHRVYGFKPDAEATTWFKAHDIDIEKAMTAWADLPSVRSLQTLPQSP